ncbi:MAG: hypothetical protein COT85_00815 [Chlamydiae bacterium CG10_big_fil_rev_8_21_14_0_10_42_34]|nr:MAG: hypothetical protein COT85_00815 [Chlamydiae bacterium CG10_big_fil_rev_8_21_14_0_10_42_34]
MNRKNTILIAVMINAGLLAVLFVAALTTQDELTQEAPMVAEAPLTLPKFDDSAAYNELPFMAVQEQAKQVEIPLVIPEPDQPLHKLPAIVQEIPAVAAKPAEPPKVQEPSIPQKEIVVKKGDNLEKIARANGTTVHDIINMNHLKNTFLKIGQVLKIPTEKTLDNAVAKKKADLGPEYYTMKVGDNPWAIAMKHHIKVNELLRLNGLNEERARKLKPGDRLRIR